MTRIPESSFAPDLDDGSWGPLAAGRRGRDLMLLLAGTVVVMATMAPRGANGHVRGANSSATRLTDGKHRDAFGMLLTPSPAAAPSRARFGHAANSSVAPAARLPPSREPGQVVATSSIDRIWNLVTASQHIRRRGQEDNSPGRDQDLRRLRLVSITTLFTKLSDPQIDENIS